MSKFSEVDHSRDSNPFMEFVEAAEKFVSDSKVSAETLIGNIDELQCDKSCFADVLSEARIVLNAVQCTEDFVFTTDDPTDEDGIPAPTHGGEVLWENIVSALENVREATKEMVASAAWQPSRFEEAFVTYICNFPDEIFKFLQDWNNAFQSSQVWIFMNFFRPFKPFYSDVIMGSTASKTSPSVSRV